MRHVISPYEVWNFDVGQVFNGDQYDLDHYANYIGTAEFANPVALRDEVSVDGNVTIPITFGDERPYRFTPLLVKTPPDAPALRRGLFDIDALLASSTSSDDRSDPGAESYRINFPLPNTAVPIEHDPNISYASAALKHRLQTNPAERTRVVVVGVVDDGIPFASKRLRDEAGHTRVDYFWAQSADALVRGGTVPFGRELTGDEIDFLIRRHGTDDRAVYADRTIKSVDPGGDLGVNMLKHWTHGAHTLDAAAGMSGDDPARGVGALVRVIAVQMPRQSLVDTSGFGKEAFVLAAVRYIVNRAERMADALGLEALPVLVNLSLGITGGPRRGLHQLEQALDEVARAPAGGEPPSSVRGRTSVLLSSGNSFESKLYGRIAPEDWTDNEVHVPWCVFAEDRTPSYLELWLGGQPRPQDLFQFLRDVVRIVSPTGQAVAWTQYTPPAGIQLADLAVFELRIGPDLVGQVSLDHYRKEQLRILLALAPTVVPARRGAPSGLWTISLRNRDGLKDRRIDCRVHRDEDPAMTGSGGRQSELDDDAYKALNGSGGFVREFGSLNGWASSARLSGGDRPCRLAVAGYRQDRARQNASEPLFLERLRPADYSGVGLRRHPDVDFSHLTETSDVIAGRRGRGVTATSTLYLSGTSTAPPQAVRQLALAIATGTTAPDDVIGADGKPNVPGAIDLTDPDVDVPAATRARLRVAMR